MFSILPLLLFPSLLLLSFPLLSHASPPVSSSSLTTVCISYNLSTWMDLHFQGTLTYNATTNLTVRYVAARNYTYVTPNIVEYFDILPPFAYLNNSNTVPGTISAVGLPLPSGVPWSAYVQNFSANGHLTEFVSRQNASNTGGWTQKPGACANYASAVWFFPPPQPMVTCVSWQAVSGNMTITSRVSALVTFDSSRMTSNPYDNNNQPYFGWKVLSVAGNRTVSMNGGSHPTPSNSSFSLSSINGTLAQWSLLNFASSWPSLAINLQTAPFAWPDSSAAWGTSTPPITGVQWNPFGGFLAETGTGYRVTSFTINNTCVAPAANQTAPAGLTAACLSGYWSDGAGAFNYVNVVYALTVLYNASATLINSTLSTPYTPIVDIVGTRTVWTTTTSTTQYLTLLPPLTPGVNASLYYPTYSTYQLDATGVSFTVWPPLTGSGSNVITLSWNSATSSYSEPGFLSGNLAVIPMSTCYNYAALQAAYYNVTQTLNVSFSILVANASRTVTLMGWMTVDIGAGVTSADDQRPMYAVMAIGGQRTVRVPPQNQVTTAITGLVPGANNANLVYLPATDFLTLNGAASLPFDTYGLTYAAGGRQYLLSKNSSTVIREVDLTISDEVGFVGSSTLCMGGQCPLVYPLQMCLRYSAVDVTGAYGLNGTVTSSLQANATVQSSGLVTSLQGVRIVTAALSSGGSSSTFVQMVTLLPPGFVNGSSNTLLMQSPYLDANGLAFYTNPASFSLSNGTILLRAVPSSSPNITEDWASAMIAPALSVTLGGCSNVSRYGLFYPPAAAIPVALSYSFSYPPGTGTNSSLVVQTNLTLHIDASGSVMAPTSSLLSQGFAVLDCNGTRLTSNYSTRPLLSSRSDQVTSLLSAGSFDGLANPNLLFLQSADQPTFGLAFNTTGTIGTGTAGGVAGAVAVRWNASQQLYQELTTGALGTVQLSVNQTGNDTAPAGLLAACVTGTFIDTAGQYGYTHITYSLTVLYSPTPTGVDAHGPWFTVVSVHGTRSSHGAINSFNYVNLLPTTAVNNDNRLYPSLSSGFFLSTAGLGFTPDQNTPSLYGYTAFALYYNASTSLYTEGVQANVGGLTGALALMPGATCPAFASLNAAYYLPPQPLTLNFSLQYTLGSTGWVANGSLVLDVSRLILSLIGLRGYPIVSLNGSAFSFSISSVAGHPSWSLNSVSSLGLQPPYSNGGLFNDFLYFAPLPAPSSPGFVLSSNSSGFLDSFGVGLFTPTSSIVLQGSGLQYLVQQQGQTMVASLCLMSASATTSCVLPVPTWTAPPTLPSRSLSSSSSSLSSSLGSSSLASLSSYSPTPSVSSLSSSSSSPSTSTSASFSSANASLPFTSVPSASPLSSTQLTSAFPSSSSAMSSSSSTAATIQSTSDVTATSSPAVPSTCETSQPTSLATSSMGSSSDATSGSSPSPSTAALSSSTASSAVATQSSALSSSSCSSPSVSSDGAPSTSPESSSSSLPASATSSPQSSSPWLSLTSAADLATSSSPLSPSTASPPSSSSPSSSSSPFLSSSSSSPPLWGSSTVWGTSSLWGTSSPTSTLSSSSFDSSTAWSSSSSDFSSVTTASDSSSVTSASASVLPWSSTSIGTSSSTASPTATSSTAFVVSPAQGLAALTAFNVSVSKPAALQLLNCSACDVHGFGFSLAYAITNVSTWVGPASNWTVTSLSAVSTSAVVVADLTSVDSVVVFLPAGLLLFTLCAQPSSTSALVIGGCVTYNTAVQVSLPYSADSNTSVVSCYLSSAVASVSSSSSSGSLSVQDLSLLSALATTAVQSSASLTLCPTDNNTTAAAGDGGVSGGSGGNVTGPASVSSRILAILGNGTAGLLRSAASSSSPTAALSTAALLAQTLATVTSGYTNASSAASPRAAGNGSDSSSGSASVGSALLSSSVSTPVGVTPMTQATFDTASAVVGLLLAALQQAAAATSTSNGSSTAATSTSSSSSTSFTSSAQQANVAVASVLGNLVQASQAALSSSSSGSSSGADSSTEDDDEQAAQLQAACARFVTSSAQVQQLVNATLQQAQAGANTSAPGTLLTTQPLSTAAFSAQAFQLTAEPSSSSSSSNSSNASSSLGGVGLSVPAGELPWTSAGSSCVSVRVVQVSGQWALCGGGQQLSSGSASAGSPSSSPATAPTLSSNMVSIDVTDAAGTAMAVSGLQQPIEFDLVASLPSGLGGLVDTSSLSPVNVSAALSGLLPTCSWYDPVLLSWSTAGCNSSVSSLTSDAVSVHCSCSHLTDFGIIYAMAGSGDGLAAITTGFPGYLVLLVVYIVLWLLTLVQLTRILNIADSAWVTERWSRLRAPLITSKDRMAGMHSTRRTSSLSSASQLVLLEHVLVFVMTTCRACSMCILYRYDSSVSFAALSGLSLLPLVLNEWVYGFVIFQWSAIYLNAVRGGGVGECDFASSSMLRLLVAFYLTMSVVSLCVVGLYVGVVLCEGEAAVQQQLAYAGILLTLCFIALLASLLFTLGLALVYSLTRDFASRHATKLFLIAATFSCTLLGQAMTLLHQAAQPNSIRDNLNTDDMFYYSLDAAGHALVLYMFKRSVSMAVDGRRPKGVSGAASASQASELRPVHSVQMSFHDGADTSFVRVKMLTQGQHSRSNEHLPHAGGKVKEGPPTLERTLSRSVNRQSRGALSPTGGHGRLTSWDQAKVDSQMAMQRRRESSQGHQQPQAASAFTFSPAQPGRTLGRTESPEAVEMSDVRGQAERAAVCELKAADSASSIPGTPASHADSGERLAGMEGSAGQTAYNAESDTLLILPFRRNVAVLSPISKTSGGAEGVEASGNPLSPSQGYRSTSVG